MVMTRSGRSEPSVFGAVQVTEDRTLIVHGPDGPTIGGYIKLGGVIRADLDRLAQLAPGDDVAFEAVSLAQARRAYAEASAARTDTLVRISIALGGTP
jgi:allophanate hydrolase subunit 2